MFALPAPIPLAQATQPGWYLEVLNFKSGKIPPVGAFLELRNENVWHNVAGAKHAHHHNKPVQVIGPLDLGRLGLKTNRIEADNEEAWGKTLVSLAAGSLVKNPGGDFALIVPNKGNSSLGGKALVQGETLKVQFPENSQIQLKVHLADDGLAYHATWWAGVPALIPISGLYASRV